MNTPQVVWYSLDPRTNSYVLYDKDVTSTLEHEFQNKTPSTSITISGLTFRVDFNKMLQISLSSKRTRNVYRRCCSTETLIFAIQQYKIVKTDCIYYSVGCTHVTGHHWIVEKRYSDFMALHEAIGKFLPPGTPLPHLTGSVSWMNKFQDATAIKRMPKLTKYLLELQRLLVLYPLPSDVLVRNKSMNKVLFDFVQFPASLMESSSPTAKSPLRCPETLQLEEEVEGLGEKIANEETSIALFDAADPATPTVPRLLHDSDASFSSSGGLGGSGRRYKHLGLIGRGGYGVVYQCLNVITNELLAVKVCRVDASLDMKVMDTIRAEYAMLSSLSHPNIVKVLELEAFEHEACVYMECLPGGSLRSLQIKSGFRFHESIIRKYVRQALLGLQYLHQQSIIHRDIKPDNMLLSMDGSVLKLSDFGTARSLLSGCVAGSGSSTSTLNIIGTPCYMAPEAVRGKLTPAVDVWALAATAVELASGKAPWSELGVSDSIALLFHIGSTRKQQRRKEDDDSDEDSDEDGTPSLPHPNIPPHLSVIGKDFILRCFELNPKERPKCDELLMHPWVCGLEDALEGEEPLEVFIHLRQQNTTST
eukprot:PhF_6_TR37089/c0_g1_i1/m.54392